MFLGSSIKRPRLIMGYGVMAAHQTLTLTVPVRIWISQLYHLCIDGTIKNPRRKYLNTIRTNKKKIKQKRIYDSASGEGISSAQEICETYVDIYEPAGFTRVTSNKTKCR